MWAIEVEHLNKNYPMGECVIPVLKDIDLKIKEKEFVSIMGPSGSGKSTLLYLMGGLEKPTSGQISINGSDILKFSDEEECKFRRSTIGFVFQSYNLIPNLTVVENIVLPLQLDQKKTSDYAKRLDEILDIVGLSEHKNHTPKELSGGQQQRVAIARAIITNPKILFADEPIGNLDSKTGITILELLNRINQDMGMTIVMVTHSKESAEYGNRVIELKDGEVVI